MATRKEAKRKQLIQVLALIIAVIVIVVAVVLFQNWWNSRPGPEPEEVAVTAHVGDKELEVHPYMSCEPGTECEEKDVPNLEVGPDDKLVLDIPEAIHNHEWRVLSIYDDPAANDETTHGAYDTETVEIPGSVDPIEESTSGDKQERPKLMVVEVSAIMIGTDSGGEETPYTTVWSLSTMSDAERAAQEQNN